MPTALDGESQHDRVLITGCSTGLGRAFAEAALDRGNNIVVAARAASKVQRLADAHPGSALALAVDVTDDDLVAAGVTGAGERFGAIDVLVNNAGYGHRAAVEEGEDGPVRQLFDTHVFGTVRTSGLDEVPDGYRAPADREALKVLINH
jgi:NAD(P)-dependent dehydrogenase (short-subunit alcohol dehydrogenase family)